MQKSAVWKLGLFLFGFALAGIFLAGCGNDGVRARFALSEQKDKIPESPATRPPLPAVIAKLRNTHYYTIFEADYGGGATVTVKDVHGSALAAVSSAFYRDLVMEGSGKLRNGKVLNYATKIAGTARFELSPYPWGNGVGTCSLRPFHTIAVDKRIIPLGSLVYIDQTKGMPLPDGTIHDGTWRADDIGGAILKDRVDLYIGKRGWNTTLSRFKIDHLEAVDVRILKYPDGESCAH